MNASIKSLCAVLIVSFLSASCGNKEPEVEVFTLYRNVPSDKTFRVHVATFDASGSNGTGSEFYNLKHSGSE